MQECECVVYEGVLPLHNNQETTMAHEHILVHVMYIDYVGMGTRPPVKINLTARFWVVS